MAARRRIAKVRRRNVAAPERQNVHGYRRPPLAIDITTSVKRYYWADPRNAARVNVCVANHFERIRFHGMTRLWGADGSGTFLSDCKVSDGRVLYFATHFKSGVTKVSFSDLVPWRRR